jgi:hypothetical protein
MGTRRDFLEWASAALGGSLLAGAGTDAEAGDDRAPTPRPNAPAPQTGSDVGSLFPFIQSQAVRSDFPLSFLRDEFRDLPEWKRRARGKLLELLHYAPPRCDPRPEVLERTDRGDHVREKVVFSTTPDIRLTGLSHPALPRTETVHTEPGRVILITELPGTSLWDRFEECRGQRLPGVPRPELLACLRAVAEALDQLRAQYGLPHLALNPGTVLFQRGRVMLMDFGLASLFWLPAGRSAEAFNPRYAAPELFDGKAGRGGDAYSLALIYQELLTGLHPFRHPSGPRRQPDLALLSAGDREVVGRALDRDPGRRFGRCTELMRALERATQARERPAVTPLTPLPPVITWPATRVVPAGPSELVPPLDQLLPRLLAGVGGGVQVQEHDGIRYLLHPGRALQHRCAAWLPPGVAQIKLTGFAQQWGAKVVECDERTFVCYVALPGTLWQRCLGRQAGLEVRVRLRQSPAPTGKLTEVDVEMTPHGGGEARRAQLLWQGAPPLLESLRRHLQARPEQRHQPRLVCQQPLSVADVRGGLELAPPVPCQGKDISPLGIGFFLPDQPSGSQVYLNLDGAPAAVALGVLARIVRARPCGDGWYEVGAAFPVAEAGGR